MSPDIPTKYLSIINAIGTHLSVPKPAKFESDSNLVKFTVW